MHAPVGTGMSIAADGLDLVLMIRRGRTCRACGGVVRSAKAGEEDDDMVWWVGGEVVSHGIYIYLYKYTGPPEMHGWNRRYVDMRV